MCIEYITEWIQKIHFKVEEEGDEFIYKSTFNLLGVYSADFQK